MNLANIINSLQLKRLKDSDDALKNIANSEKYLQQSYEGRYLFELIQNVRDANKLDNKAGFITITLSNEELTVSNSGAPFSERGINSVTTIGDSPKESQDFIGFKGIGFKSVHEVSDNPKIVTDWGTVLFDRKYTKTLLNGRQLSDRDIPLFFIPHYDSKSLSSEDKALGIVTKVVLPIKEKFDLQKVEKAFEEIGVHQVLLLGNLEKIEFLGLNNTFTYQIKEDNKTGKVNVTKNGQQFQFKHYKPSTKVAIPQSIIEQLDDKEREIYRKEPFVDMSIVFDMDDNNRLVKNEHSKLFLFYPTEINSGFNFIIHSYFLVTPDRKGLRDSILNRFLLVEIAKYLAGEWLTAAKRNHKTIFLDFLVFERNISSGILKALYDTLIESLKSLKFLFDRHTNKFYRLDEVIIADGFDKGLFPENVLNGKRLIYIQNEKTRDWLISEFKVSYLSYTTIAENIEKECIRQRNIKNFKFFENLYRYLVEYDDLNLKGKKVLLTNKLELLSSEDYVFYGLKERINFPASVQKKIHFIHPSVKISEQRQGKGQTGFIEFNTELLVRRLLRLYEDNEVAKEDILFSLLSLNISERLLPEVRQKIFLPVKAKVPWLNPLRSPIYIETPELLSLFPKEKFIDQERLNGINVERSLLLKRFRQFGAWDIPAIFYSPAMVTISSRDQRFDYLYHNVRSFSTPYFEIYGDWILDTPKYIDTWFTQTIISNWNLYISIIENEDSPSFRFKSQTSDLHQLQKVHLKHLVSVTKFLKEGKWIKIENFEEILTINEVTGIDPIEAMQPHAFLYKKYLKVLPVHFLSNSSLLYLLGITHLDSKRLIDFKTIFQRIFLSYSKKNDLDKDFVVFYNKIIGKLFDMYSWPSINKAEFNSLTDVKMLGINEVEQKVDWKFAKEIYYIEDKPGYDLLPIEIKSLIQPNFTNRDKNRFGQIAKRIGLDFKKTIQQRLEYHSISSSYRVWEWLPYSFEALGLVEVLLEINLDGRLEAIKKVQFHICNGLKLHLYKDGTFISTLDSIAYTIQIDNGLSVYISESNSISGPALYSSILHDILVDILGRDLHRVRLSLNDFYSRRDKTSFLESFEVTKDRIDEISMKVRGVFLTHKQAFWLAVSNLKHIKDPLSFLQDGGVDLEGICLALSTYISQEDISELECIEYENLSGIKNIRYLVPLFQKLELDLLKFNDVGGFSLDFREYYKSQFEGLKAKHKSAFEKKLHSYLSSRSLEEKSTFQDLLDAYADLVTFSVNNPVIFVDSEDLFLQRVKAKFPTIELTVQDLSAKPGKPIASIFKRNISLASNRLGAIINQDVFQEFLSFNINRSLFYFDDTVNYVIKQFEELLEKTKVAENHRGETGAIDLSAYVNSAGTIITRLTVTERVNKPIKGQGGMSGKGKRVDGSKEGSNLQLIGIVAEKLVYEKLCEEFQTVEWVSKNAAKAGINPEGSDVHGFDIKYVDNDNLIHYVEVKGKTDQQRHFFISYPEYKKALAEKDRYHIFLVLNTLKNNFREILDLGNIFSMSESEDIFNNPRFTADFNTLEISFK